MTRLLAISGSIRRGSYNTALLGAAEAELPPGVEFVLWQGLVDIPPFDEDIESVAPPLTVAALRAELARADAVLIATPEYNASIPGALKNALDWVSRPYATNVLRNKPVAVIGASTGLLGAVSAQAELRKVLRTIGATVDDTALHVPTAQTAFSGNGRLSDDAQARALRAIVRQLVGSDVERAA
jgi:chromate reductase, NAD(P)H dehydrogenase (quinone)